MSAKVKPGYKLTEVGVIPEDWDVSTLDSLGRSGKPSIKAGPFGSSLTKNIYVKYGYKVYGQEQVIRGDYLFGDYFITKERFNELKSCSVESGDILLSLVGTAGRVLIIPPGAPAGIINPRLIRFSFDRNSICPVFFKSLIETDAYQSLLSRSAQGGTMGVLNAGLLKLLCIPLPSLVEQEAIAEALSDTDVLIESIEQLITKKRQIKQGAMQELLTGKKRLPGFSDGYDPYKQTDVGMIPDDWCVKTIEQISDVGRGRVISHKEINTSKNSIYPVYSSQTSSNGVMGYIDTYDFEGEYVTWTTDGANAGTVFYRVGRFNCTNVCGTIKLKSDNAIFVSMVLGGIAAPHVSRNLGNPKLMNDVVKKIKLPLPHTTLEQKAIATILSDINAEIDVLVAKLEKARQIKQGMMHNLLLGKTRLL